MRHSYLGKIHSTAGYCLSAIFPDVSPGPTLQCALSEDCGCRPALLTLCAHLIQSINKACGLYLQHLSQTSLSSSSITMTLVQAALTLSCTVAFVLEFFPQFLIIASLQCVLQKAARVIFLKQNSYHVVLFHVTLRWHLTHSGFAIPRPARPSSLPALWASLHALLHPGFLLSHQHSGAPLRPCPDSSMASSLPFFRSLLKIKNKALPPSPYCHPCCIFLNHIYPQVCFVLISVFFFFFCIWSLSLAGV